MTGVRSRSRFGATLVALVCTAQVFVQLGAFFWPALLPGLVVRWGLPTAKPVGSPRRFYGAYIMAVAACISAAVAWLLLSQRQTTRRVDDILYFACRRPERDET